MKAHKNPLVSVVIPFLNVEAFLDEAICSVLRQDYQEWELLLVDDGSADRSTAIARKYAAAHPGKIFYCDHAGHVNRGQAASRNEGIRRSRGELIAFLDADDLWLAGKLADQVGIFQRVPGLGMAVESSLYWYDWDGCGEANTLVPVGAPQNQVFDPPTLSCLLYPLRQGAAPCPSSVMVTRRAIERAGGFEESFAGDYSLYEDQVFLTKIYLNERVYVSSRCQNLYRQRAGSVVKEVCASGGYHRVRRSFLEWMERYLKERAITDARVHELLSRALAPYRMPMGYFLTKRWLRHARRMGRVLKGSVQ